MFAPFGWETFPEYLEWLQGRVGVNVLTQIGHSALRRYVMGEDALERPATAEEIAEMVRLAEEAMDAGAAGVSSSQAPHQRGEHGEHIPSFFADERRDLALAEAVRRKGKRLLSINPAEQARGPQRRGPGAPRQARRDLRRGRLLERLRHGHPRTATTSSSSWKPSSSAAARSTPSPAASDPRPRFTLKKLSSLFAAYEPWPAVLQPRRERQARGARRSASGGPSLGDVLGHRAPFMVNASVEKATNAATEPLEGRLLVDIAEERGIEPGRGHVRRRPRRQARDVLPASPVR